MRRPLSARLPLLLAATALIAPGTALAQAAPRAATREAQLEARLERLEAEMQQLRSDLAAARSEQVQTAAAAQAATSTAQTAANDSSAVTSRVAALEARKPEANPSQASPTGDGFRVGNTTIKLGGFVRVNAIASRWSGGDMPVGALGKEFYLPQQIPVGGKASSEDMLISARQTRLSLGATTPVGDKEIKAYVEFDFALATAPAGAQRATNPYTPTFRRGFIQYGNLLVGQEWSTFQNYGVLPESTDFAGPIEGTVFVRQGIVQYKVPLNPRLDLLLAVENPETETLAAGAIAYADVDDDVAPDVIARLNWRPALGEFSLAGIGRMLRAQTDGVTDSAFGWGVSAAGRIPLGQEGRSDLRFMATYGQGIGRYLGLGYVADAVQPAPGAGLEVIDNFAGFIALRHAWTANLRSTIAGSYQWAGYPGGVAVNPLVNKTAWSASANLFWTPVKSFDVGVEYRRGERELLSGASGTLDRIEFAFKYGF